MKRIKKGLAALLILAVLFTTFTACGKNGGGDSTNWKLPDSAIKVDENTPSWKSDKRTVDLNWYVGFDWFTPGQPTSVAFNYVKEDTGVNITYLSGGDDKINSLIAAKNLPDIITVDGGSSAIKDLEQVAIPLDVLSEKYDPYFMKTAADPEIVKFYTNADGHLYMYPNFSVPPSDYTKGGTYGNEGLLVRKDIYEAIGSPDMSTPQGFLDALDQAKAYGAKDANGKDVIPFGINNLEASWVGTDSTLANMLGIQLTKDSKIVDRYTDPDFVSWMKVFADANRKGFMDPDLITMGGGDRESKISNGVYFAYLSSNFNADPYTLTNWYNLDPEKAYIAVEGPASLVGNPATLSGPSLAGWTRTFISKTCKDPQKAMELVTYLSSDEGNMVEYFGREGKDYTMVDGKAVPNKEISDLYSSDPVAYQVKYGFGEIYMLNNTSFVSRLSGIEQFIPALQQPKQWTVDHIKPINEDFYKDRYLTSTDQRNNERIKTQWCQTFSKILTAQSDTEVDQFMKEYTDFRDANGYDKITEAQNKAIAENIAKLK